MIGVDKIDDIRRLGRCGASVASIARSTGVSEPTVRKYLRKADFSEKPPRVGKTPKSPLLAPHTDLIDSWLREDRRCWFKQRHTAKRVYDRLVEERGFEGSYSTVRRYVKCRRTELAAGLDSREAQGFLLLDWLPGECQVDFGQADFRVRGVLTRGHFLVVTFPHSQYRVRAGVLGGDGRMCLPGLGDVVRVPGRRAAARRVRQRPPRSGRRVGAQIVTSGLFRRFAAHYGLDYSFTNPYSGNEKGSVENKVGALRRNLFVPIPQFFDVKGYNKRLLEACLKASDGKPHYRKGATEPELFEDDRAAPLAPARIALRVRHVAHQEVRQAGRLQGRREPPLLRRPGDGLPARSPSPWAPSTSRSSGPAARSSPSTRASGATRRRTPRDPALQLRLLCARPGGWRDSVVRRSLPGELVGFLDSEEPADLGADLRALRDVSARRGWAAAVEGARCARSRRQAAWTPPRSSCRPPGRATGDALVEYDEPVGPRGVRPGLRAAGGEVPRVPRLTDEERGGVLLARARSLFISRATIAWFLETATPRPALRVLGDARPRAGVARAVEAREAAQAGQVPRTQGPSRGSTGPDVRFPEGWGREEMLSLDFVGRAEDLVFHGPTGRGKTHMATALGIEATRRGIPVRFHQTASLVLQLGKAKREGTLDRLMADIGRASLVILDEFGYVPFDVDGARLLYQVISDSYERRRASCSPPTWSSAAGARSSPTTSSPPRSWTASSTTAGSWSSAAPATGWSNRSCWASQEASGVPVPEPEEVS